MLVTTAGGPMVTLLLAVFTGIGLFLTGLFPASLWNPFIFGLDPNATLDVKTWQLLFKVNYWGILINLIPMLPLDGGRMVQEMAFYRISLHEATKLASTVGMGVAVGIAALSLWGHELFITGLAVFCFIYCFQTRQQTIQLGAMMENEFGYDFSQGYTSLEKSMPQTTKKPGKSWRERYQNWVKKRREQRETQTQLEMDRILEKISAQGMESLTSYERRVLQRASKAIRRKHS
jgi:hypothetical protein